MNAILKAVSAALTLVPAVVEAVKSIVPKKRVDKMPWGRKHSWQYYREGVPTRLDVPYCLVCQQNQTPLNDMRLCDGPAGWR